MSHLGTWTQNNFIAHEASDETPHPAHYLRCEKLIGGDWVTTAWAEDEKAFKRHAGAVGGTVRCGDFTVITEKAGEVCENNEC
jgi:hypothetical protein